MSENIMHKFAYKNALIMLKTINNKNELGFMMGLILT